MNLKTGTVAVIVMLTVFLLGGGFGMGFLMGHLTTASDSSAGNEGNTFITLDEEDSDSDTDGAQINFWSRFGLSSIFSGTQKLEGESLEMAAYLMGMESVELEERLDDGDLLWNIAQEQGLGDIDILVLMYKLFQLQLQDLIDEEAALTPTLTSTVAAPVYQEQPSQGKPGDNRPGEDMAGRQPGNDKQMMDGNMPQPPGMPPMVAPTPTATPTS